MIDGFRRLGAICVICENLCYLWIRLRSQRRADVRRETGNSSATTCDLRLTTFPQARILPPTGPKPRIPRRNHAGSVASRAGLRNSHCNGLQYGPYDLNQAAGTGTGALAHAGSGIECVGQQRCNPGDSARSPAATGALQGLIPGTPPGHQAKARSCNNIERVAPAGSWILYRPSEDRKVVKVQMVDSRRMGVIVHRRTYDVARGTLISDG
jgi:hypothetical protein